MVVQSIAMFFILLSLQTSYNVVFLGLSKEYKMIPGLFFILGICIFGLSL
jgi:hypothetical protein